MIRVEENSGIPLFGLDFLGIIDRGTNILEIKPITVCNLHCKYCFVSAGDYHENFVAEQDYLLKWIKKAIAIKRSSNIELHIAPYGEFLLYPKIFDFINKLKKIPEVSTISAQSNGLLLTEEKIKKLEDSGLDRINISLNSMDAELNANFCGVPKYDLDHLIKMFDRILQGKMDLLIAPVWFFKKNDQGIFDVIKYVKEKEKQGYSWPKLRLGIQNYLTYKTGRKIGHVKSREFGYFYQRLRKMEKEYNLKLKLGPKDFNMFKISPIIPPIRLHDIVSLEVIMKGRWDNEYIAKYNDDWAVKILTKVNLAPNQYIKGKLIRSNLSGNILTAILP